MRSIPRDHDSMDPARKKALGMSGLKGCEECFRPVGQLASQEVSDPKFQKRSLSRRHATGQNSFHSMD